MKKILTLISLAFAAALSFTVQASLNGTGYYRIYNNYTGRYIYVTDNKGSLNYSTTSADMGAIELWMGIERTLYDPATVLYCKNISGNKYDIQAQGTGIYQMIGFYVTLFTDPRYPDLYMAYGSAQGLTKYLFDGISSTSRDQSFLSDAGYAECKYWKIEPIDAAGNNYFGVKSTVATSSGEYYAPFYAEFPFSFASEGMKACYITKVDAKHGYAVYKEITGTVPGATPLFIKCKSSNHSDNRLNIGGTATAPADNIATGVYFNNDVANHVNHVAYNPQTMRVLGTMTDGTLALVTENYDYVPRNTFYVNVPAGSPAQFQIVSESEYQEIIANLPIEASGITLSSTSLTLTLGGTASLTATVLPEDASDKTVTWTSSNPSVATVDANGNIAAMGIGTANISATTHNGITASCQVTVTPIAAQSITVTPEQTSIFTGNTCQLVVNFVPANTTDKTVTWSSSDMQVATVDAAGVVTGVSEGQVTITATTSNGIQASATVSVTDPPVAAQSITVTPEHTSIFTGNTCQLVVNFVPANTTDKTVTWSSSDMQVATVDAGGVVTGVSEGEVTITATTSNGIQASATVNVIQYPVAAQSITITPGHTSILPGNTCQLVVNFIPANTTDKTVTWSSSDTQVATVDANGLVTGVVVGEVTITATTSNGIQASATVSVTTIEATDVALNTNSLTLTVDEQATLIATLLPEGASYPTVYFSSTDESVASVESNGVVTALRGGTAEIHATCGSAVAKCSVTVLKKSQAITWEQDFGEVHAGDKVILIAEASSGLPVRYEATTENAVVNGNELTVLAPGDVRVRAHQDGDDRHEAAAPVELSFIALAGINDAIYDAITVEAGVAQITIKGKPADAVVYVYSMGGTPVYVGTDSCIGLQSHSAYLVVIGGRCHKLVTK